MIRKILSKEKKNRLNFNEIFTHPWVVSFENCNNDEISTNYPSVNSNFSLQEFKKNLIKGFKNSPKNHFKYNLRDDTQRRLSLENEIIFKEDSDTFFENVVSNVHKRTKVKQITDFFKTPLESRMKKSDNNLKSKLIMEIDFKSSFSPNIKNKKSTFLEEAVEDIGKFHLKEKYQTEKKTNFEWSFSDNLIENQNENSILPLKNKENYMTKIYAREIIDIPVNINVIRSKINNNNDESSTQIKVTDILTKKSPICEKKISKTICVKPLNYKVKPYLLNALEILENTKNKTNFIPNTQADGKKTEKK